MLFSDRYELISLYHAFQRLHSQNVDHGLNDLTDSFTSFMTRARYFAVGHIKRTLSQSAVELMYLRREMLPPGTSGRGCPGDSGHLSASLFDFSSDSVCQGSRKAVDSKICVDCLDKPVDGGKVAEFFSTYGLILSVNQSELANRIHYCVMFSTVDSAVQVLSDVGLHPVQINDRPVEVRRWLDAHGEHNEQRMRRSATSTDALSDELLIKVLSSVDLYTFIRCERVCQKWNKVTRKFWKDLKELNLPMWLENDQEVIYNTVLKGILSRVSPQLESLDISVKNHFFNEESLKIITRHCPMLQRVSLRGFNVRAKSLKAFSEQLWHTLTHLSFTESPYLNDKALWWLLRHCRHLRRLDLSRCSRICGINFSAVCSRLEELHLDGCAVEPSMLEEFCATKPFLKVLHIDDCCLLNDRFFSLFCRTFQHLRALSVRGRRFKFLTSAGLRQIGKLNLLEELHLDFSRQLDDECMAAITNGCPDLKTFTCAHADVNPALTSKGLCSLRLCPKLSDLDLSDLERCDDDLLMLLASNGCLETVRVRNSSRISDKAIAHLARHCLNLKEVDVSGCVRVTEKSMKSFARPQFNRSRIVLVIGGSGCNGQALKSYFERKGLINIRLDLRDHRRDLLASHENDLPEELSSMARSADSFISDSSDDDESYKPTPSVRELLQTIEDKDEEDILRELQEEEGSTVEITINE